MTSPRPLVDRLLQLALDEDLARGDVTSESIFTGDTQLTTAFRPRQPLVVSGLWVVAQHDAHLDPHGARHLGQPLVCRCPVVQVRGY